MSRPAGVRDAMAGYIPGLLPANHSQEKEFAQAYEDVLERYKGKRLTEAPVCCVVYLGKSIYSTVLAVMCSLYICYLLSVVQGHWRWMVGLFSHEFVKGQRTSSACVVLYSENVVN